MKIILAGNYQEFRSWCDEQHIPSEDRTVIYARDEHYIRGIHGAEIIVVGTFWERKDADYLWTGAQVATIR